jgi:nitroreductase
VKRIVNAPEEWRIVSLISFGYPEETPNATSRKPLKEIASYNRF